MTSSRRWPTQKARILAWTSRGHVARQYLWMQTPAPDGGPPITRLAAIIGFLEADGHQFHHRPIGGGLVEYVYVGCEPAAAAAEADPTPARPPEHLFELTPTPQRALNAALSDYEDEAA